VLAAVDKYRPTLFPGVPTMYVAINNAVAKGGHDLSSIKACLSGAAPLPLEVAERFERFSGGRLVEGYGLSESSPVAIANPIYGKRKAGTIGLPLPDTLARVADPSQPNRTMPVGEPGELALAGPQVMLGYWNRPDDTAQVLQDGWLLTGDMAVMDEEGYFSIVDRKKDLIIAGGYNIYPREVEEVLYEHPKVLEVCVAGVPDSYRGEIVKAFVVLRSGEEASVEDIREFAKGRLAAYKVPRSVEFRDELPKTLIGKVLRRALVEEEQARQARETAESGAETP
jgi:long-chain acyl-CoA synthetase